MTNDKGIFIKNIYYMLSYAFQILKQSNYQDVAAEEFDRAQDLFAALLARGVAQQLKQGLYREYVTKEETLSVMRGKLDLPGTIRSRAGREQKLACVFDELSADNVYNQILKTTMWYLIRDKEVDKERKAQLSRVMVFFDGIMCLEPSRIPWSRLTYQRCNQNYEMLINICCLVLDGMLQTTEAGGYRMTAVSDAHMARLYEKFILAYFRHHHRSLTEVRAARVKWNLDGETDEAAVRFLPVMQTDIYLRKGEKILIIDAKYYGKILRQHFDKQILHSGNLYQMYTYVKNQDNDHTGNTAGLLLYAKTDERVAPDAVFHMDGNRIGVKTLDLNTDFRRIAAQLDQIAEDYLE